MKNWSKNTLLELQNVANLQHFNNRILKKENIGRKVDNMSKFDYSFKLILLGDAGVGKSTMVRQLSKSKGSMIGNCCCYSVTTNCHVDVQSRCQGKLITTKIIDTAGQERYRSMTASYFRGTDGCILMFNVNSTTSFENTLRWYETLQQYTSSSSNYTTVIVAAVTSNSTDDTVPEERIRNMAEHLNLSYLYMDLRKSESIVNVLDEIGNEMVTKFGKVPSISMDLCKNTVIVKSNSRTTFKCGC